MHANKMIVPFVSRPDVGISELAAVERVFESKWLGMGSVTREFEQKVSEYLGSKNFLAVNTGTSALHLALESLGIGPGCEVITPSMTFAAAPQAICECGAEPVFCDVEENTLNIDVEDAELMVTDKTKAIIPVHYRGQACDMDRLLAMAEKHGITIIDDASHAFGSKYKGQLIGSFGHVTCFSFDPIKNITCGEGGGIVFQDNALYEKAIKMRLLGIDKDTWSRYKNSRKWFYDIDTIGFRYHMPNFCAAIGLVQLGRFEEMRRKRIEICKFYDRIFSKLEHIRPFHMDYKESVPFCYMVRIKDRDCFMRFLESRGVGSGVHYIPVHTFDFFKHCNKSGLLNTKKIADEIATIPMSSDMSNSDVLLIIDTILEFNDYYPIELSKNCQ